MEEDPIEKAEREFFEVVRKVRVRKKIRKRLFPSNIFYSSFRSNRHGWRREGCGQRQNHNLVPLELVGK